MEKPLAFCTLLRYTVYKDSVKKFIKIIKNLLMQKGRSRYEHWWYPDRCVHRHYGDCRCGKPQQEKRRRGTAVSQKNAPWKFHGAFFIWFVSVARTAFCLAAAVAAKPSSDTEQGGQAASWALEPLYPPP